MKKLLLILFIAIFVPAIVYATDVTFKWDAFPADSDVDGVRVYVGRFISDIDYSTPVCTATVPATTCTADLSPWRFYKAVGRAYANIDGEDLESADSNMATGFVWGKFIFRWGK